MTDTTTLVGDRGVQAGRAGILFPAPLPGGLFVGYWCPLDDMLAVPPITNYWLIPGTECEGFTNFENELGEQRQFMRRF